MVDKEKFQKCCDNFKKNERVSYGIGTLSEKAVHSIFKNYYEKDADRQEIPIENFVADIYNEFGITEIQTAQFEKMRNKLECFLVEYDVTIVHPIPRNLYIVWVDKETGECSKKRKSSRRGTPYHIFPELYKIKKYLNNKNLHIRIAMMDATETRFLNTSPKRRKKSAGKIERFPEEFVEEIEIERVEDYMQFVPYGLEDGFSSKDFANEAHIDVNLARVTLNILSYVGVVDKIGKKGNSILYGIRE